MKGIILAGGTGSRLFPATQGTIKQLIPIYDKPLIYYPLSVLMLAGIRDILIISTKVDLPKFQKLLGGGKHLGLNFEYIIQPKPDGLAQALILGESFIQREPVCLALGDNIHYGNGLTPLLFQAFENAVQLDCATIFGYSVENPIQYGVLKLDNNSNIIGLEEKPANPPSNYAITGLYFYPSGVSNKAKLTKPSKRGELEITEVNQIYLKENRLKVQLMGRGFAWFDVGTHDNLLEASNFVQCIEKRQGLKIACPEEIAYQKRYITKKELIQIAKFYKNNNYGRYLLECYGMTNGF